MFGLLSSSDSIVNSVKGVIASPGITPYDHTNPAFRVFEYDENTFELLDYENYYIDLYYLQTQRKTWDFKILANFWELEYSFTASYPVSDLSDESLIDLYFALQNDPLLLKQYYHLYFNLAQPPMINTQKFLCAIYSGKDCK